MYFILAAAVRILKGKKYAIWNAAPVSLNELELGVCPLCAPVSDPWRVLGSVACCYLDSCHTTGNLGACLFFLFYFFLCVCVYIYIYIYDFSVLVN